MAWSQIYKESPMKKTPKQDVTIPESTENLLFAQVRYWRDRAIMAEAEQDGVAYRWQSNGLIEAYCLLTGCNLGEAEKKYSRNQYGGAAQAPDSGDKQCCKDCGAVLDEDDVCIENADRENEYRLCFTCHCTNLENGNLTHCESCGAYFSGNQLQVNPKNGIKELCPYCNEVWCE